MIFRCERIRNQNRGEIEVGKLRKRRRTGSRDGNIRDSVRFLHAMIKGADKRADTCKSITFRDTVFILPPGKMDELNRTPMKSTKSFHDRFIDPMGSLTSTHHQYGLPVLIKSQVAQGILAINRSSQATANWSSSHFQSRFRKMPAAFRKSNENFVGKSRIQKVRLAGNCIGFVNKRRQTGHAPCKNRCR